LDLTPSSAVTQAQIRGLLANEEAEEVRKGNHFPHEVTTAVFVRSGLDIEELQ
jgi:hypothetical protein